MVRFRISEAAVTVVLLLPAMVLILMFTIFPAIWGIFISTTNYALLGTAAKSLEFLGLKNYIDVMTDLLFWKSLRITVEFVVGSAIIGQFLLGLGLALLTYNRFNLPEKVMSAFMMAAWIIPETVFAYIWLAYLNTEGLLNQVLHYLGIPKISWLVDHPLESIIIANIWRGTAWSWLLFVSALRALPREIHEAAEIDGATGFTKARYVLIPLIRGHIITNLILITLWTFNQFGWVYAMTGGGPAFNTLLITIYAYLKAFKYLEIGPGAAVAVLVFLINLGATLLYLRFLRR